MFSSEELFAAHLDYVSAQFNRYLSIFIFIFGLGGNMLNVVIFCQRRFRSNPCAFIFMISSVANFIAITSGLTSRMLSGWAADLTATDRLLCKLIAFILNVARPIAFWLIFLAAVDRWLLSSRNVNFRRHSNLKNAQRGIFLITVLSIILFSYILYCYEPNLTNAPLRCYGITLTCRLVTDICFTFVSIVIPLSLMLIFGLLTIRNIRLSKNHAQLVAMTMVNVINTGNKNQHIRGKKTDHHLFLMLVVQIFLLVLFGLPLGIQKLYDTTSSKDDLTPSRMAIDNFIYNFVLLMSFLANGMPFYIYTLVGGSVFRHALIDLIFQRRLRPAVSALTT